VMIHFSLRSQPRPENPEKVDVVGGLLLALTLGLATFGLYNPAPDGKQVLPSNGALLLIGALLAAVAFFVWERFARTRLIEPAGVHFRPFLAALGASLVTGAALMVTLVNVELFGQGVLGQDQNNAAFLLLRFLVALPIGALLGGWIATRIGDRTVACVGLLIAAGGYYLVSGWTADVLSAHHDLGFVTLPMLDTDLTIAGLGLGLVIAPLTSATLRVVPAVQHGIASAAVVVARMIGMLIGVAALSAWGLYKFNQYLQERLAALPPADPDNPGGILVAASRLAEASRQAYVLQYGEIFKITCVVCIVGAALALLISGHHEHADEPAEPVDAAPGRASAGSPADDNPTQAIEAQTQKISSQTADETARLEQPRGHYRPE
jgi:Na+/melibiose symporter-like transporter